MNVVFMGTPNFAKEILEGVINSKHPVVAVVVMPEKKGLRGNVKLSSPVKELALKHGIDVFQFEDINESFELLDKFSPHIGVTAAYGKILKKDTINYFQRGIINVHASILPFYRGASPVQCALLNGEKEIGVSIIETVLEVDAGDVYGIKKVKLNGWENALECLSILSKVGKDLLVNILDEIENEGIIPIPQEHDKATFCKKIQKEDGRLSFSKETALEIYNKFRAYMPWPSIFCDTKYGRTIILKANVSKINDTEFEAGQVVSTKDGLIFVKCKQGILEIHELKVEGRKALSSTDFLLGRPFARGEIFSI